MAVTAQPVKVCVQVGTTVVMHGGGNNVDGYWAEAPIPDNVHTLRAMSWSSTGGTFTLSGVPTAVSTVEPGNMTAQFLALAPGTAKVVVKYAGVGKGYPLKLTVTVVPKG